MPTAVAIHAEIRAHSVSPPSEPDTTHPLTLLVSLPPSYPAAIPPQLQLLSRYVGPYGVDPALFGAVLRTYISRDGVEWAPGGVCVFDGVEWVREACGDWLGERMSEQRAGEILREDERAVDGRNEPAEGEDVRLVEGRKSARGVVESEAEAKMPEGVEFTIPEPIVDRKSVFIGRACPIMHPSQVCTRVYLEKDNLLRSPQGTANPSASNVGSQDSSCSTSYHQRLAVPSWTESTSR